MGRLVDPAGRSYFLVPRGMSGDDVRRAVLATYEFNRGCGYGDLPVRDFPPTPFSDDEIARIQARQAANGWSYRRAVRLADRTGIRLATTPGGMLIAAGGTAPVRLTTRRGGTTWGDIFFLNAGRRADPVAVLRLAVRDGVAVYERGARVLPGSLALDRLLHHEEIHARQWAREGPGRFPLSYVRAELAAVAAGVPNRYEVEAGLGDGGYL